MNKLIRQLFCRIGFHEYAVTQAPAFHLDHMFVWWEGDRCKHCQKWRELSIEQSNAQEASLRIAAGEENAVMSLHRRKPTYVGDIKPYASFEAGQAIKADCRIERYVNGCGTHMLRITHLPTGQSVESNMGVESDTLSLLAANLPEQP